MSKSNRGQHFSAAAVQQESPSIGEVVAENAAAPEVAAESPPAAFDGHRVFSVSIPQCLLKERFFVATDEQHAYEQYKALGGITVHPPQLVREVPPGSRNYLEAVAAHNAASAK